jgi:hypothetical protein
VPKDAPLEMAPVRWVASWTGLVYCARVMVCKGKHTALIFGIASPIGVRSASMEASTMASTQQTVEFDKTLHDVDVALDALTDTLSEVEGCEYPRLLAREIQALIVACMAHERSG